MRKKVDNGQTALSRCLRGERGSGRPPFVRPYENENYEMEKELEKSWRKMSDAQTTNVEKEGERERRRRRRKKKKGELEEKEQEGAALIRGKEVTQDAGEGARISRRVAKRSTSELEMGYQKRITATLFSLNRGILMARAKVPHRAIAFSLDSTHSRALRSAGAARLVRRNLPRFFPRFGIKIRARFASFADVLLLFFSFSFFLYAKIDIPSVHDARIWTRCGLMDLRCHC